MQETVLTDPPSTGHARAAAPAPAPRATILLVDDQPARLLTYEAILQGLAVNCVRAHSGGEALEKMLREEFAVVLLDVQMPDIDGFEVARLVREHPRLERMPIIFVTGAHVSALDQLRGYEVGAIDYIAVPVVPEILRSKVAVLVELYQRRKELRELNQELSLARQRLEDEHSREIAVKDDQMRAVFEHPDQTNVVLEAVRGPDGNIQDWIYRQVNRNACRLLGREPAQLLGARMSSLTTGDWPEKLNSLAGRVLSQREPARYESLYEGRHFQVIVYAIADNLVVATGVDITERKAAENALRDSEQRFRELANNIDQFAWTCDVLGRGTWYNDRWYEYTGTTFEEASGEGWKKVVDPAHLPRVEASLKHCFDTGEPWEDTFPIRGKDGAYRWFLSRAVQIRGADGRPTRWFGTNTDVTELRELQEALKLADRRKDEFLAMLAHELRNPVAPILSAAEALGRLLADDDRQQMLVRILLRQGQHLSRLLDDLLDVARVTQGRIELRRESLALSEAVEAACETLEPKLSSRRQVLRIVQAPDELQVHGDRVRLAQCIGNLLSNASKFSPDGAAITVTTRREDDWAVLEVRDQGCGIDAAFLPYVFDLFAQSATSIDRSKGGLGIGLSVCRKLIEMHGGRVQAASEAPGKGSVFSIYLPTAQSARVEKLRVLIIDDNVDAADSMAMLLKVEGHLVETAYTAESGLDRAVILDPDIVLLDIGLPRMDGCEVARRLRSSGIRARLIAVTGYGEDRDRRRVSEAGFHAHLTKPVDFSALGAVLRPS